MPELLNFSRDVLNTVTLLILASAALALPFMVIGSVLAWRDARAVDRALAERAARRARLSATR